jgi:hypothetical protein
MGDDISPGIVFRRHAGEVLEDFHSRNRNRTQTDVCDEKHQQAQDQQKEIKTRSLDRIQFNN